MLAALQLIETFRTKGEPLTGGVFRVCWDAALDCGAKLRVTSNRKANVRKGNRPARSLFGFNRTYAAWSGNTAPAAPFTLATIERALASAVAPRPMTILQDGPQFYEFDRNVLPPVLRYGIAAWEHDSDRIFREIDGRELVGESIEHN
jgi:hypothetical protein